MTESEVAYAAGVVRQAALGACLVHVQRRGRMDRYFRALSLGIIHGYRVALPWNDADGNHTPNRS